MKIALLSDIHANFSALQTVSADLDAWRPDLVIVAGDLVNRGPKPRECLDFVHHRVRTQNWFWLRGNHEDYVLEQAKAASLPDRPENEVHRASRWTSEQLNGLAKQDHAIQQIPNQKPTDNLELLKQMPFRLNLLDSAGDQVSFVHASMQGIRAGIYPESSNEAIISKISKPSLADNLENEEWIGARSNQARLSLFGVGHTHRPLIRQLEHVLVVNAGSAGLPFDHDTRLSYARLTHIKAQWRAEIVRCEYDRRQAEKDFYTSGYLEGGGPLVQLVLIELQHAQSQLYHWAIRYQERALRGEISMEESVKRYLSSQFSN